MSYVTRKIRAASERGRRMAQARWAQERARQAALAALDPVNFPGQVVRRIVVIEREVEAREIVFYEFDGAAERRRKLRAVRALAL